MTSGPGRTGFGATPLEPVRRMEALFCGGRRLPSPQGGALAELGVKQEPDGTSTALLECESSALRYELPLRQSGWRERRKVRLQAQEGVDPVCPRAAPGPPLIRQGSSYYCPRCRLMFGRVP